MSASPRDSDTSLINGLIFGLIAGAALVVVLSPEFRARIDTALRDLGVDTGAPALSTALDMRDEALSRVAPPPDPLSSSATTSA
jgi:hypothetical protein